MTKKLTNNLNKMAAVAAITPKASGSFSLTSFVNNLLTIIYWAVGVIALVAIIYGGFIYMTAGGDSEKTTKARNIIMYAILGVVVVALAIVIINWAQGNLANFFTGGGTL